MCFLIDRGFQATEQADPLLCYHKYYSPRSTGQLVPTTFLAVPGYAARFAGLAMVQDVDRGAAAPSASALRRYGVALGSVAFALLRATRSPSHVSASRARHWPTNWR